MSKQDNLLFWEEQASKYKDNVAAVNFDNQEENLEFHFLKNFLKSNQNICDLGCGNGRTIFSMIEQGIDSNFYGIDMTKGMIDIANKKLKELNYKNVSFYNLSATIDNLSDHFNTQFDTVLSKRLLINIKGDGKYKAIDNIHSLLKDGGIYIMIESFIEPLNRINEIRHKLNLATIHVHDFNEYLTSDFINNIKDKFVIEQIVDFESLYYFISRIFNAKLSEGQPDYNSHLNKLAVELSKYFNINISGYSPQLMYILKKI